MTPLTSPVVPDVKMSVAQDSGVRAAHRVSTSSSSSNQVTLMGKCHHDTMTPHLLSPSWLRSWVRRTDKTCVCVCVPPVLVRRCCVRCRTTTCPQPFRSFFLSSSFSSSPLNHACAVRCHCCPGCGFGRQAHSPHFLRCSGVFPCLLSVLSWLCACG